MSNKLGIFLAGGVAGAAVALLCAPRTGQEARTLVAEKVNAAWGQAQNIGFSRQYEKAERVPG